MLQSLTRFEGHIFEGQFIQIVLMGNSNSLPEIPGGGTDGYHVLRVQVT